MKSMDCPVVILSHPDISGLEITYEYGRTSVVELTMDRKVYRTGMVTPKIVTMGYRAANIRIERLRKLGWIGRDV